MKMRNAYPLGVAMVVFLGLARANHGQVVTPPDLNNLVHQMGDRVRHLGEDIASDLGQTPAGRHLIQDTQELAQAVDEFHESLHNTPDLLQRRQAYAGIETTWQHLRGQLAQASSPAVIRAANRVEQLDAQIRQALGVNVPPVGFYGGRQAPTGIADTQRLAHALTDRAESLAATIQADMGRDPNGAALARDARELARLADAFHDAIDSNQPVAVAAQAFGPVDAIADRIERFVTTNPVPPRVQNAWQAFASVESLIHQNLGLGSPQPQLQVALAPPPGASASPIVGLSNQLVQQISDFVQVFGPTAGNVPEGGAILADAQRLLAAAADFQQDAARGLPPNQLAYEFRDVDATWQRLARRVNRIARGRQGPNIQQVQRMGATIEQLHRVLGMPGYPPVLGGPGFGPRRDRDDDR
jgi:hypothetical protein